MSAKMRHAVTRLAIAARKVSEVWDYEEYGEYPPYLPDFEQVVIDLMSWRDSI